MALANALSSRSNYSSKVIGQPQIQIMVLISAANCYAAYSRALETLARSFGREFDTTNAAVDAYFQWLAQAEAQLEHKIVKLNDQKAPGAVKFSSSKAQLIKQQMRLTHAEAATLRQTNIDFVVTQGIGNAAICYYAFLAGCIRLSAESPCIGGLDHWRPFLGPNKAPPSTSLLLHGSDMDEEIAKSSMPTHAGPTSPPASHERKVSSAPSVRAVGDVDDTRSASPSAERDLSAVARLSTELSNAFKSPIDPVRGWNDSADRLPITHNWNSPETPTTTKSMRTKETPSSSFAKIFGTRRSVRQAQVRFYR